MQKVGELLKHYVKEFHRLQSQQIRILNYGDLDPLM
jgi:hypothetical protein